LSRAVVIRHVIAWFLLVGAFPAQSQYPSRPLRLIVPFAAGSVNDLVARVIASPLADQLGQQLVIDNRAGAGGNLGAEIAAKAAPDGYTLLLGNVSHTISVTLYDRLNYDFVNDFAPVSQLAVGGFLLAVHPSLPVKTVKDVIALARARPGELNVGVAGAGIIAAAELFKVTAAIDMTNVAYKGTPQILSALASGEVSVAFPPTSAAVPQIKSGRIRGLAVTGRLRSPMAPEIATVAESGLPRYEATTWYCLMAPARTPADIVARLASEVARALKRPDVVQRFTATDLSPTPSGPEQLGAFLRAEIAKWAQVVKASGMRPD
jgi:tripartite-type tricarboxylate transporter receptor subunit TctC